MKVGIAITNFSWPGPAAQIGPAVSRLARFADEAGFDSLWTMDHFFQIRISGEPPEAPMLEAYSTLGFMAGYTTRIALGTCVTSVAYRHPGVLIKTVTTLDVLSSGRVVLGVGAGVPWSVMPPNIDPLDVETVGLGIPMLSLAERFEQLEELLQIAHQMWRGDEQPYNGQHYQMARLLNSPNSLQRPHPPILIGGSGEAKTLRLVAQYADACNLFDLPGTPYQDNLGHKLDVLRRHCEEAGRDYGEIEKTTSTVLDLDDRGGGLRRFVDHLGELASVGIDQVILSPPHPWTDNSLAAVASVLDEAHAITGASPARQAV
jgi:F420-dependent oxidoreductase-like protein